MKEDKHFLKIAIGKSKDSIRLKGFPVGAILVKDNKIISEGISNGKNLNDPTSHAETDAIRKACEKLKTRNLKDLTLYSSLEPCLMCFSASNWASIKKIVYAVKKESVSKQHFQGDTKLEEINEKNYNKIELIHIPSLEESALEIINNWESSQKTI
ncbi:MAG: nucleoside deaminase [Nanoarchaeota archaeon]